MKTGRDITITYTPKDKTSNGIAVIEVLAKPNQTPVSTDKEVLEAIKNMPDVLSLFTKPTYEQTGKGLKAYLAGESKQSETAPEPKPEVKKQQTNDEFLAEMNSTNVSEKTPTQVEEDFEDLFKD